MRIYNKRVFWLIIITFIILIIWIFYFYKESINISLELIIPLNSNDFILFLWTLFTLSSWLFWWLYKLDLQEEKEKHLWYIRTINDRIWKKIDWNFFTNIEKAKKFCDKEEYYILPFWSKYNISNIDFYENEVRPGNKKEKPFEERKIEKYKKFNIQEILDDVDIKNQREFIDFDKYIKNLDLHWKNKFDKNSKIVVENYIEKNNLDKDILINLFENWNDFVIIEWYCYLYKF